MESYIVNKLQGLQAHIVNHEFQNECCAYLFSPCTHQLGIKVLTIGCFPLGCSVRIENLVFEQDSFFSLNFPD
jgi:hypothetical protein